MKPTLLIFALALSGCAWYHRTYVECGDRPDLRPCTVYDPCAAGPLGPGYLQRGEDCRK